MIKVSRILSAKIVYHGSLASKVPTSTYQGISKNDWLGNPKITGNANAADLRPKLIKSLQSVEEQPFMGKYSVKMSPDGAAVMDGNKCIACYYFGDTLVVDKPYRRRGIGEELVYLWRTSYPGPAKANTRTRASQHIQEKVWDRLPKQ